MVELPPSLSNPYLKVAHHLHGAGIEELKIELKLDTGKWQTIWRKNGPDPDPSWRQDSVSLGYWTQKAVQFRISARANNFRGDAALDQFQIYQAPQPCLSPTADFDFEVNHYTASFDPETSEHEDAYEWLMAGARLYDRSPRFTFSGPGRYPVLLKVKTACGKNDTIRKYVTICDSLDASFAVGYQGDTVVLNAGNTQGADGYAWDLDGGKRDTGVSVKVSYNDLQTKQVRLTVYNACDTITNTRAVEPCPTPVARLRFQTGNPPANGGLRVNFDASYTAFGAQYFWDFGDGQSATGLRPSHVYSTPTLSYVVTLIVESWCGYSDTLITNLQSIGIDDPSWKDIIEISPNPSRDEVKIAWPAALELEELVLRDAQAKLLQQYQPEDTQVIHHLRLGDLPAGTYYLSFRSATGHYTAKLVLLP